MNFVFNQSGDGNTQIGFIEGYEYKEPEPYKPKGREKFKKPIELYGPGPEGKTCKTCKHHISYIRDKTYHKCEEWRLSHSEATDIRLSWTACARYER